MILMDSPSLREDLDDMCFSEYLLEDPATQDDSDPEYVIAFDNTHVD